MNACPNCGKKLEVFIDRKNYDLEGKRWYQYADHKRYCKYCNCRLKYVYPAHMRFFFEPQYTIFIPVIIYLVGDALFKKHEYGFVGIIVYAVISYLLSRKVKYECWVEPESKKTLTS